MTSAEQISRFIDLCQIWNVSKIRADDNVHEADIDCPLCGLSRAVLWLDSAGIGIACNPGGVHPQDGCLSHNLFQLLDQALDRYDS